jgi:CheY-like chemotaxis protein
MEPIRILVVDDSAINRLVLRGHLEAAGFEVVEANCGTVALALIGRERYGAVVMDIVMPGMDGFAICRAIRDAPEHADAPVLFLSALSSDETRERAFAAGGNDIFVKPFDRVPFLRRLRGLLGY